METVTSRKINADSVEQCKVPLDVLNNTFLTLKIGQQVQKDSGSRPDLIVHSFIKSTNLVGFGGSGFLEACMKAYDQHYPLSLSPDVVWQMILNGFSKHVNLNAEKLRSNFVTHSGKEAIRLFTDRLPNDPDYWERFIFPGFSSQVGKRLGQNTYDLIVGSFTTTTPTDIAVREITVMTSMQKYFGYYGRCCCGIPYIQLEGTVGDWESLLSRANILGTKMLPEFWKQWGSVLIPVLEEIVEAAKGKDNTEFWQKFVKEVEDPWYGSGSYNTLNGWINNLVPYWGNSVNPYMKPWENVSAKHQEGGPTDQLPSCVEKTPVHWDDNGTDREFEFHAGVMGFVQDTTTFVIKPVSGYFVVEVFEDNPVIAVEKLKQEKRELEKALECAANQKIIGMINERLRSIAWKLKSQNQ